MYSSTMLLITLHLGAPYSAENTVLSFVPNEVTLGENNQKKTMRFFSDVQVTAGRSKPV